MNGACRNLLKIGNYVECTKTDALQNPIPILMGRISNIAKKQTLVIMWMTMDG
jgi:hypothetical protein